MKKIFYSIITLGILAMACNKKVLPVITERKTDPPSPQKTILNITPDLARGKMIFTNRCGRCHDLPKPEQYTSERWKGILSYMNPRAGLNEEQGVHITAYLQANAAK
ncbi:MAG TPA: hypothetical protein VGO58_14390 [Chitinophagaceae bacterium]|jgi:hypothetical protein|nr:hypothetical protein [Chitinophagaceae bacterium]